MDEAYCEAVNSTFVKLYNDGLIYQGTRMINWDPAGKTAVSNEEVIYKEEKGYLWHIKYMLDDGGYLTIATTRPETMLGDTAVAVNPKDNRYKKYVNKTVTIPIVGRKVKIIEDDYADPEQGTGALKITPAHDFNDYDVGKRNKLEIINIFTEDGKVNSNAISSYVGLDRFEARKKILNELKEKAYFVKEENIKNKVPYGDRSNSII